MVTVLTSKRKFLSTDYTDYSEPSTKPARYKAGEVLVCSLEIKRDSLNTTEGHTVPKASPVPCDLDRLLPFLERALVPNNEQHRELRSSCNADR